MYRIFSRVKTVDSIRHKLNVKYADKKVKIQDMIQDGFHIGTHIWVIVFVDDVATLVLSACGNTLIWKPFRRDLAELLVELLQKGSADYACMAIIFHYHDLLAETYGVNLLIGFSLHHVKACIECRE